MKSVISAPKAHPPLAENLKYNYIVKRSGTQEPIIKGTRIAVRDVVEQWKLGSSPEEISIRTKYRRI